MAPYILDWGCPSTFGRWVLFVGRCVLGAVCWVLGVRCWVLGVGCWALCWALVRLSDRTLFHSKRYGVLLVYPSTAISGSR